MTWSTILLRSDRGANGSPIFGVVREGSRRCGSDGALPAPIAGPGSIRRSLGKAVPFYDNLEETPIGGLSCLVEVERVYGLD